MTDTMEKYGRIFNRAESGGWLEVGAKLPRGSTAKISRDAVISARAAKNMHGGTFEGGTFLGGTFLGGTFRGGTFWGGTFEGGMFRGGTFWGGTFRGGMFRGGMFEGGTFRGGMFEGGTFRGGMFGGGMFMLSPSTAQRSDGYVFVVHFVDDNLRIWAGCRNFSWDDAVSHWDDDHKHGAESQRIIHFLKAQAEAARPEGETS